MPFIGEITMFACNYAPKGWATCDGQLYPVSAYSELFSIIVAEFGGDGKVSFGLPDLGARAPLHWGAGLGLLPTVFAATGGQASVSLTADMIPAHTHAPAASLNSTSAVPAGDIWSIPGDVRPAPNFYASTIANPVSMNPDVLSETGGNLPHNNLMPYQVVNFCIALNGEFPHRG